jgi:hypothetical protein
LSLFFRHSGSWRTKEEPDFTINNQDLSGSEIQERERDGIQLISIAFASSGTSMLPTNTFLPKDRD